MKKVEIWLDETSEPIVYQEVINTYTKKKLYCIYCVDGNVYKYPIEHLFRSVESYGTHGGEGIGKK